MALGYDMTSLAPKIVPGYREIRLLSDENGIQTHHERLTRPKVGHRSVFPTTYHLHSDDIDGEYTLLRSSLGNEDIAEENADKLGDDIEADLVLFWLNVKPLGQESCQVTLVAHVDLGETLPKKMKEFIG